MIEVDADVTVYENEIEEIIVDCLTSRGFEMDRISQNQWNYGLSYAGRKKFSHNELKRKDMMYNEYDLEKVEKVLIAYIELCSLYSKEISINGFCKLIQCEQQTLFNWRDRSEKGKQIYKMLQENHEESLSGLLISKSSGQVGIIASLNHHFGWQSPLNNTVTDEKKIVSAGELRELIEKAKPNADAEPGATKTYDMRDLLEKAADDF